MLDILYAYGFLLKWSLIGFGGCVVICAGITFAGYLYQTRKGEKLMPEYKGTGVPWNPTSGEFKQKEEQIMVCEYCGKRIEGGFYQDDENQKGWTLGGIFCSEECLEAELEDAMSFESEGR